MTKSVVVAVLTAVVSMLIMVLSFSLGNGTLSPMASWVLLCILLGSAAMVATAIDAVMCCVWCGQDTKYHNDDYCKEVIDARP